MADLWNQYLNGIQAVSIGPWLTGIAATTCLGLFIGWMLRTGRIHERYALPYVTLIVVLCGLVLVPTLWISVAQWLGFAAPSNLLYFICLVGLLATCIHLTAECTQLREHNRDLVEGQALLTERINQLEKHVRRSQSRATASTTAAEVSLHPVPPPRTPQSDQPDSETFVGTQD